MTIWLWIALASNIVYWSIFFYLLATRRWDAASLAVGVLHMLFASPLVVAPFRSLLDPSYVGWQIGLLRFEGAAVTLPATLVLAWALIAAWLAVAKGRGRWMKLIAAGDTLFALNLVADFFLDLLHGRLATAKLQGGEHFTLVGPMAALIPLLLFALPFVASAIWAVSRVQSGGTTPPLASENQGRHEDSEDHMNGTNGFRYCQNHV